MNQHQLTLILTCIAGITFIAQIVSIPFRKKRLTEKSGNLVMPLENTSPARIVAVIALCAAIIALVPLKQFALWICAVILLAALLGENFAIKEACTTGRSGIYENVIVLGTNIIFFDDIFSLPTLAYENDSDTVMVDRQSLQVMKKDNTNATLVFESQETRESAVAAILKLRPNLNPEANS
ncbi:MAG: hypothetical protein II921_02995 [Treponema sp.]|nr:hypothetical protein [Treponema sp.]